MKKRTAPQRLRTLAPAAVSSALKSIVLTTWSPEVRQRPVLVGVFDPRIEGSVEHVDDEIDRHDDDRDKHHEVLNHRIIPPAHRLDEKARDARNIEDGLGDNEPAEEKGRLDADDSDDREHRVLQRVVIVDDDF